MEPKQDRVDSSERGNTSIRLSSRLLFSALRRKRAHGLKETKASIANKLARATVPATFLLAALEMEGMRLEDL
jgi:hypothetical protein